MYTAITIEYALVYTSQLGSQRPKARKLTPSAFCQIWLEERKEEAMTVIEAWRAVRSVPAVCTSKGCPAAGNCMTAGVFLFKQPISLQSGMVCWASPLGYPCLSEHV